MVSEVGYILMNDTINYYNTHASEFSESTLNADMSASRDLFVSYLKPGDKILDAGCGVGRDIKAFCLKGFSVDAFDASEEMCRIAEENTGIPIRQLRFEDFCEDNEYDGIWACASLLHVKKEDLFACVVRMKKALKKNGIIYMSFKYGEGAHIRGERLFIDMNEMSLIKLLDECGLGIITIYESNDVRQHRQNEKWINAIVRKEI